jgi:hypothetical protein
MLPILLGIGTAVGSAISTITAGQAVAIGAATAVGFNMLTKDHKSDAVYPQNDDDEVKEKIREALEDYYRMKKKV